MLINNIDLTSLGVQLYDRVLTSNYVDTNEEWLDGDIQPTYIRAQDGFKTMNLSFLILGPDEQTAFIRISKLTQMLRKATIKFDDLDFTFDVSLTGAANESRLRNGNFVVSYTLRSDYAKGEREIYTTDARATNSFKLTVMYYQNSTMLLSTESVTIRAAAFNDDNNTFESVGININKYRTQHYQSGIATNFTAQLLTYEALQNLQTLIINYAPTEYNLTVDYYINSGSGFSQLLEVPVTFTYPQLQRLSTIGQLVNLNTYRPEGYKASVDYTGPLTVEALLAAAPISVLYEVVENERSKNITVRYEQEQDDGTYDIVGSKVINVRETNILDGMTLADIITADTYRPDTTHYNTGYFVDHAATELITYDTIEVSYVIRYSRTLVTLYVEYYAGTYPNWYRMNSLPVQVKYKDAYEDEFSVTDLGIDLNKYHTATYNTGVLYNSSSYTTYDDIITAGVLQVYYVPIDYPITVSYYTAGEDGEPENELLNINELMFFNDPTLNDIFDIAGHRPDGFEFDADNSYRGEITLAAITQNAPITIVYREITAARTKNIIIRYRQELASAYTTINTSLITVNEADCVGGVRLRDIIALNAYRPDYYNSGILDGYSEAALVEYDDLQSNYNVLYMASTYFTTVRYYTDDVDDRNWIGSSNINYRIIDFTTQTTLYDLGLNLNLFKPAYTGDGIIAYTGPINFSALRELASIPVVYESEVEPEDPDEFDYPHRFLFLQHNDMGEYEVQHPNWTMNHAYINTGVTAQDMSKLTVIMECGRVDHNTPLEDVNVGHAYLFGSASPDGAFYMRFNNDVSYGGTGDVNTYEAKAGLYSNPIIQSEETAIGFGANTGIYESARDGYSIATFTYSSQLQVEHASMPYPLYLFANNSNGSYADGLAGYGIYGCRIYYDGELIRDLIPVQFYDKIGDQIAPSNCLYDKVSRTFLEDATGMNSFNIIDDDRYIDDNPTHKIGQCYVNYYKDMVQFNSSIIYFRGDEFEQPWDMYDRLRVVDFQPQYYRAGEIINLPQFPVINFEAINNAVFQVNYEEIQNQVTVNYYRDQQDADHLIHTDYLTVVEKDFYQVPTFGDIVRLNKYRPEGYATDFEFTGSKITLQHVVQGSPYNILYVPEENPETYTTTIKYQKKVYGPHQYEQLGTINLELTEGQFRDGEYIDYFINFNAYKPTNYYGDGEPFEWYKHDERLATPNALRSQYVVSYAPVPVAIPVNYYTDDIDPDNLVASTDWVASIDDFDGPFYLVDMFPLNLINKFKPGNAAGGILQNSNVLYTFDELVQAGSIDILYESVEEPSDPESAIYEKKVLYFKGSEAASRLDHHIGNKYVQVTYPNGGCIPYIDLGYRPEEIGRLKVEAKVYFDSGYFEASTVERSFQDDSYLYGLGYIGALANDTSGGLDAIKDSIIASGNAPTYLKYIPSFSKTAKGGFGIRPRLRKANTGVYTDGWFTSIDGDRWTSGSGENFTLYNPTTRYTGLIAKYRKANYEDTDLDYNPFVANKDYTLSKTFNQYTIANFAAAQFDGVLDGSNSAKVIANPYTVILDAYNSHGEIWTYADSNTPYVVDFDESEDTNLFDMRCKPKGSITLFRTRNPETGKMNIYPFMSYTYPLISGWGSPGFGIEGINSLKNPYSDKYTGVVEQQITVWVPGEGGSGVNPEDKGHYENVTTYKNVAYSDATIPIFPQLTSGYVWEIKIYDQDRLVRHLIPVAKDDVIYNYTMPANGLFDLVTEIFFGNGNEGGTYTNITYGKFETEGKIQLVPRQQTVTIKPEDIAPLHCIPDPCYWGKVTENYYDYDNTWLANQLVDVPVWFNPTNDTMEDILQFNDFKPSDFYLNGILALGDPDIPWENYTLKDVYDQGTINTYYKLRTFAKTVVYYQDNVRVGSQDIFFSLEDIANANSINDLGINVDAFYDEHFAHGRLVFDETIFAEDDVAAFIDAPSPVVIYDKLTKEEAPNLLYLEYYRGGASDEELITVNEDSPNYLDCELEGVVLNPNGTIKYYNHYHNALYEDEQYDYFLPYQVKVAEKYVQIHYGPGRKYKALATIAKDDVFTIVEEANGWGRLREYYHGWIMLNQTTPITGPGQNPDYDVPGEGVATIPYQTRVDISKMTIDRLWCYLPDYESWVKAEDLSFDQAGRLYNGLGITVIDLDEVVWSGVDALEDIGIYPEAYKLQYHNFSGYTYDGEYTKAAFEDLHEIDFVYPETVYNSSCIYYDKFKDNEHKLGQVAISYTLSDWNPDWDLFLETSYKVDDNGDAILPTIYRGTPLTLDWNYFGFDRNLYKPAGSGDGVYLWNPRAWNDENINFTFEEIIVVGTQYVIYPEYDWTQYKAKVMTGSYYYNGANSNNPNPPMVRLGWNIKNEDNDWVDPNDLDVLIGGIGSEFLPVNAYSGIGFSKPIGLYDDIQRVGGRALYPNTWGNATYRPNVNSSGAIVDRAAQTKYDLYNHSLLANSIPHYLHPTFAINFPDFIHYDNDTGIESRIFMSKNKQLIYGTVNNKLNKEPKYFVKPTTLAIQNWVDGLAPSGKDIITMREDLVEVTPALLMTSPLYNERNSTTYTIYDDPFSTTRSVQIGNLAEVSLRGIELLGENMNIINNYQPQDFGRPVELYSLLASGAHNWYEKRAAAFDFKEWPLTQQNYITMLSRVKDKAPILADTANMNCYTFVKIYHKNLLKGCYVPIMEGMTYTLPDGTTTKAAEHGFLNLLDTNELVPLRVSFMTAAGQTSASLNGGVYRRDEDLREYEDLSNMFADKLPEYFEEGTGYILVTGDNVACYDYPDVANTSGKVNLAKGLIIPYQAFMMSTTVSPNIWFGFQNPYKWMPSQGFTYTLPATFNTTLSETKRTTVCTLSPTSLPPANIYRWLDPSDIATRVQVTNNTPIMTIYEVYNDRYGFTGTRWIDLNQTTYKTTFDMNNYVVTVPNIQIYSQPIESPGYRVASFTRGDRITVTRRADFNTHWCQTGYGWIYNIDENLSLVE